MNKEYITYPSIGKRMIYASERLGSKTSDSLLLPSLRIYNPELRL